MKNFPTLADAIHAWTYGVQRIVSKALRPGFEKAALDLRMTMRSAHRFVLDDEFLRQATRKASTTGPEQMLRYTDLANLPYDNVWIEYDNTVRMKTSQEIGTLHSTEPQEDRGRAGFLLERVGPGLHPGTFTATYCSDGDRQSPLSGDEVDWHCGAAMYLFNLDGFLPDLVSEKMKEEIAANHNKRTREASAAYVDGLLHGVSWGYGKWIEDTNSDRFVPACTKALAARGAAIPEGRFMKRLLDRASETVVKAGDRTGMDLTTDLYKNAVFEGRGDLRFIATVLSMINCVPTTYVHRPVSGGYSHRLRNLPFLDNKIITIHCGKTKRVNLFVDHHLGQASRRRRHGVRGFWRDVEYGHAIGCAHEPVERDGDYCLCGKCGHLLRWIEHHERGDATLGYVRNDYEVKI